MVISSANRPKIISSFVRLDVILLDSFRLLTLATFKILFGIKVHEFQYDTVRDRPVTGV